MSWKNEFTADERQDNKRWGGAAVVLWPSHVMTGPASVLHAAIPVVPLSLFCHLDATSCRRPHSIMTSFPWFMERNDIPSCTAPCHHHDDTSMLGDAPVSHLFFCCVLPAFACSAIWNYRSLSCLLRAHTMSLSGGSSLYFGWH